MIQSIMLAEVFKRKHEAHFVRYDMAPFIQGNTITGVTIFPDNPASQMVTATEVENDCIVRVLFQGGLLPVETFDLVIRTAEGQVYGFTVKVTNRDGEDIAATDNEGGDIDGGEFGEACINIVLTINGPSEIIEGQTGQYSLSAVIGTSPSTPVVGNIELATPINGTSITSNMLTVLPNSIIADTGVVLTATVNILGRNISTFKPVTLKNVEP